jgi:hypothetical protein
MSAALVIVFLLNGVQVNLPAPAYMLGDTAYVPARAVFEDCGLKVEWDAARGEMHVSGAGRDALLVESLNGASISRPVLAGTRFDLKWVGDRLYVPVRDVADVVGGRVGWDKANMTVNLITAGQGEAAPADIGAIIADPPKFAGQRVRLRGEFTGWEVDAFGAAVTHGAPVARSDWTMRDGTGALWCSWGSGAHAVAGTVKLLDQVNDLGRRMEVVGTVALTAGGWPYLQMDGITLLEGLEGVTCYVTTDRDKYAPGDTIRMQMLVRNPTKTAVVLNFNTSQQYDFVVSDVEGKEVWKWSDGMMFAQMVTSKTLAPGDSYTVKAEWTTPGTAPARRYKVSGLLNRDVKAYVKTVGVGGE